MVNRAEEPGQFSEKLCSKGRLGEWDSNKILQKGGHLRGVLCSRTENKWWKGHIFREKYHDRIYHKVISLGFLWGNLQEQWLSCLDSGKEAMAHHKGIAFCTYIHFALFTGHHHLFTHFPLFLMNPLKVVLPQIKVQYLACENSVHLSKTQKDRDLIQQTQLYLPASLCNSFP